MNKSEEQMLRTRGQIMALTALVALALSQVGIVEEEDERLKALRENLFIVSNNPTLDQRVVELMTEGIDNIFESIHLTFRNSV